MHLTGNIQKTLKKTPKNNPLEFTWSQRSSFTDNRFSFNFLYFLALIVLDCVENPTHLAFKHYKMSH